MFSINKMNKHQKRAGMILLALLIILLPFLSERVNSLLILIIYFAVYCGVMYSVGKITNGKDYSNF
ncbi:hypothetical protein DYE48_15095 [Halobacillus trueperi]|uniref:Uncharacterized protein n=1 Tax=Halobacillus trueperi TaxID=156205 RepID=A0A3E0J5H6_9BACI|nr:hypothetical protein DYE48_15095 [Halobacillus trueperi]